jgi:two-component system sensor histidine kinase BaeS
MLTSLRGRLLTASIAIAVTAVAATAWLTSRNTSERLRDTVERTLESDGEIYAELLTYGQTHSNWEGVDGWVAALSEEKGRRIALTYTTGTMIADSARLQGRGNVPLPERPAALIDPLDPKLLAGFAGESPTPMGPEVGLTDDERRDRQKLIDQAVTCLRSKGYEEVYGVFKDNFPNVYVDADAEATRDELATIAADTEACEPDGLYAPSQSEVAAFNAVALKEKECLTRFNVRHTSAKDADGMDIIKVEDDSAHDLVVDCRAEARRKALKGYVAEPVRLYLGERNQRGVALTEGRTLVAAGGVALIALMMTVLASRRVLQPVAAMTAAAQRLERGDLSQRVVTGGRDELAQLARAFNSMADAIAGNEEERRRLASDVAHELRTPLANLRGYVEAAQDGVMPADAALLASLHEEAVLLQRLVDDLQTLSLAEAHRLPLHLQPIDIKDIVAQASTAFRVFAEGAEVELVSESQIPTREDGTEMPTVVDTDPLRLRQVLGNLLANALRYTPKGGRVTVRIARAGDIVALSVADTGAGITPEHLPHVFDRFWRADASRTRDTGGSGLGLAICHRLIDALGGSITVESALTHGTTFTIRLPARD